MDISPPAFVIEIISRLQKSSFEVFIVGGAVRDIILGKDVKDWDFTTNATPQEILKVFPEGYYDNKFGTVGISHDSSNKPYEITTYRTEDGYSDSRRPDKVSWGKSLDEDLKRRDFTINAMALKMVSLNQNKPSFEVIDYYGGQKDLDKKIIRAVGNPFERFSEDALRLMRAIRIASELNFKIETETFDAIKSNAGLINRIAKERVRDELLKIMSSNHPYEGILLFRDSGLMQEIIPELEKTFGVEQKSPQRHHIYDVGTHSLFSLKFCKSMDPITRFAALIHDIGKPQTYKKLPNGIITFYNHEIVGAKIAERIADRLCFSNKDKERLVTLVRRHQFTVDEKQTDSAVRRFITNVGKENIEEMLHLRVADRLGGGASESSWRLEEFKSRLLEVQKQPFGINDLKIDGFDIMNHLKIKPGPEVGQILNKLFEMVVNKKLENNKDALLAKLEKMD